MKNPLLGSHFTSFLLAGFFTIFSTTVISADSVADTTDNETNSLSPIPPFQAHYIARAKGIPFKGKAVRTLRLEKDIYRFSMQAKSMFTSINEQSDFSWFDTQKCTIRPSRYNYQRKGLSKDRNRTTLFNWEKREAVYQDKELESRFTWQGELTDKLSEHLAVRCHLKAGHKSFSIQIADRDIIKEHHFTVTAEENIETGIGTIKALKLERTRKSEDRRSTTLWLAPELDYLLIRLEQEKRERNNPDKVEQSFVITLKKLK
ncbi:MAG: DUF3108 domain-containing protein [Pseudomonadales bacterium]|nr:DUF3108 domain-containing protein [Pseudomonadales bacterium]